VKQGQRLMPINSGQLRTDLSRAYGEHYAAVLDFAQPRFMGWVCTGVLDGIDARAQAAPNSDIAAKHRRLMELLRDRRLVDSGEFRDEFTRLYREAEQIVFPASTAFVAHSLTLTNWTRNWSLAQVDLGKLRALDLKAHDDPTFRDYVDKLCGHLPVLAAAPRTVLLPVRPFVRPMQKARGAR
jgi:hypothetical protein